MPYPDEPCPDCPRVRIGLPMPCEAMTSGHRRMCDLAAAGHADWIARLCGEYPRPKPDRAAIEARRAMKTRLPLGVRPPQGRR